MGSGKSLVGLVYFIENILGGSIEPPKKPTNKTPIYIITTARKRDDGDWIKEASKVDIKEDGLFNVSITVDSWNNIKNYINVKNAFFIFDEQRSVNYGSWSKSFIKIARKNEWLMLSGTPGDRWMDYAAVFIANGYYKNKKDFVDQHVVLSPYTKYPSIRNYVNEPLLDYLLEKTLVSMPFARKTKPILVDVKVNYNEALFKEVVKTQWNFVKDLPIQNHVEMTHLLRRVVNSDSSRIEKTIKIQQTAKKLIVFYNYNYELELLKEEFESRPIEVKEYNGHKHEEVPDSDEWVYLVQYTSGNEAWECFSTNHMLFYSLNYSYKIMMQSMGRIDRMTTTFEELYYYRLVSESKLDKAILKAHSKKRDFNAKSFSNYY